MDEELNLGDFLLDPFPVVGHGLGGIIGSTRRHRSAPIIYVVGEPTDYTGRVVRVCVFATPLAFHHGSGSRRRRKYPQPEGSLLDEKPQFLPPSAAHFSSMSVVTDLGRSRA